MIVHLDNSFQFKNPEEGNKQVNSIKCWPWACFSKPWETFWALKANNIFWLFWNFLYEGNVCSYYKYVNKKALQSYGLRFRYNFLGAKTFRELQQIGPMWVAQTIATHYSDSESSEQGYWQVVQLFGCKVLWDLWQIGPLSRTIL